MGENNAKPVQGPHAHAPDGEPALRRLFQGFLWPEELRQVPSRIRLQLARRIQATDARQPRQGRRLEGLRSGLLSGVQLEELQLRDEVPSPYQRPLHPPPPARGQPYNSIPTEQEY